MKITLSRVKELRANAPKGDWQCEPVGGGGFVVSLGDPEGVLILDEGAAALVGSARDLADDAEDLHVALATMTAQRDAAVAARDGLAGAVREERELADAVAMYGISLGAAEGAGSASVHARSRQVARVAALGAARESTDALLTATPVAMVRASDQEAISKSVGAGQ